MHAAELELNSFFLNIFPRIERRLLFKKSMHLQATIDQKRQMTQFLQLLLMG